MQSRIIDKKEIQLGDRKIEVRLVECNVNQHQKYYGQRIYARFLDKPTERITIDENKKIKIGNTTLTDFQIRDLRKAIGEIEDEKLDEEIEEEIKEGEELNKEAEKVVEKAKKLF